MTDRPNPSPENALDSAEHTPEAPGLTAEIRAKSIASLQSHDEDGIKQVIATGDRCLELEHFDLALVVYIAAEATEKLIDLGDRCFQVGRLVPAIDAYAAAGAKTKLLDLADQCLDMGLLGFAEDAYQAAGYEISKD